MNHRNPKSVISALAVVLCATAATAQTTYVIPMIGGGQTSASMIHTAVMLFGMDVVLDLQMEGEEIPMLRALKPPDEFNPAEPWALLQDMSYNFQYAWYADGPIQLPDNSAFWVERLHHDEGLHTYLRPPCLPLPAWMEVFTYDGYRWMWNGSMAHNAYAVANPQQEQYQATYLVYVGYAETIGDVVAGDPVPGYSSATITWTWRADFCDFHIVWADADDDGDVDQDDFALFQQCYSGSGAYPAEPRYCQCFDRTLDWRVNGDDLDEFNKCSTGPNIPWSQEITPDCAP